MIYNKTTIKVIVKLRRSNHNIQRFAREVGIGWCHLSNIIHKLELVGIVTIIKKGKVIDFNLTDSGIIVRDSLLKVDQIIQENTR